MRLVELGELQKNHKVKIFGPAPTATSEEYDEHGTVRFIRTADVSAFELSGRPQKLVSEVTYEKYETRQGLKLNDILFVKDGDNRIGEMAILTDPTDLKILVQTHFKIIRPLDINPFLLLWSLNTPEVRQQIRQRIFIQSTLGTIGNRILDLRLPFPTCPRKAEAIAESMESLIRERRNCLSKIDALSGNAEV